MPQNTPSNHSNNSSQNVLESHYCEEAVSDDSSDDFQIKYVDEAYKVVKAPSPDCSSSDSDDDSQWLPTIDREVDPKTPAVNKNRQRYVTFLPEQPEHDKISEVNDEIDCLLEPVRSAARDGGLQALAAYLSDVTRFDALYHEKWSLSPAHKMTLLQVKAEMNHYLSLVEFDDLVWTHSFALFYQKRLFELSQRYIGLIFKDSQKYCYDSLSFGKLNQDLFFLKMVLNKVGGFNEATCAICFKDIIQDYVNFYYSVTSYNNSCHYQINKIQDFREIFLDWLLDRSQVMSLRPLVESQRQKALIEFSDVAAGYYSDMYDHIVSNIDVDRESLFVDLATVVLQIKEDIAFFRSKLAGRVMPKAQSTFEQVALTIYNYLEKKLAYVISACRQHVDENLIHEDYIATKVAELKKKELDTNEIYHILSDKLNSFLCPSVKEFQPVTDSSVREAEAEAIKHRRVDSSGSGGGSMLSSSSAFLRSLYNLASSNFSSSQSDLKATFGAK